MKKIAIIGGTGLYTLKTLQHLKTNTLETAYGKPSSDITTFTNGNTELLFLSRHGFKHQIAPHLINYKANIAALKSLAVTDIIAINAVGGIGLSCSPSSIVIPHQLIDYTYAREHTYNQLNKPVNYVDFSEPYCEQLRNNVIRIFNECKVKTINNAVYAATQGPRLETQAEIQKLKQDGCTIVGMTGMPEAVLAKELDINYVSCSIVVNWAAGIKDKAINMSDIKNNLTLGMQKINLLLQNLN